MVVFCVCVCVCVCVCARTHKCNGFICESSVLICVRTHTHIHTHTLLRICSLEALSCLLIASIDLWLGMFCTHTHTHTCTRRHTHTHTHTPFDIKSKREIGTYFLLDQVPGILLRS